MKNIRWLIITSILFTLIGITAWLFSPHSSLLRFVVTRLLSSQELRLSSFSIDSLSNSHIKLSNVSFVGEKELSIQNLEIFYKITSFSSPKLTNITAETINFNVFHKNETLVVGGLESLSKNRSEQPLTISTDIKELNALLPSNIDLKNVMITYHLNDQTKFTLPFNLHFQSDPTMTLHINSPGFSTELDSYQINAEAMQLHTFLNNQAQWQGNITAPSITLRGLSNDIAPLTINVDFILDENLLEADLRFQDLSGKIKGSGTLVLPVATVEMANLNLKHMTLPWSGGTVSTQSVLIPFDKNQSIPINLKVENIDLSELLETFSEGKVSGTGRISGLFPIVYHPNGTITLKEGVANHIRSGTISVSPELLPGENAQLEIARSNLENFHYTDLKILVSSEGDRSAIDLIIEGRNPDSSEKRAVKFTIRLTGDIIPLLRQSTMPFNDFKELLKQDHP
jgi:hypothetical protein